MEVSNKTLKVLETANQKEPLICGYKSSQIKNDFEKLINGKAVEVGFRTSCGPTDKTHKLFKEWVKIINSLKKYGFVITEENVTHPNKSPTMAVGFWNSIIYSLKN